jgi:saccharopine dehydrogenase-like NADP-dependent oxidoreductase
MSVHIVVVGGGGAMGRIAVRALAEDDRVARVTAVDLRPFALERTLSWLRRGREKVHGARCDIRDERALGDLLAGAGAVLNAADYPFNLGVMRAAIAARVHYADLGGLFHMTRAQYELHTACEEAGITAVLGIGSTPGITNVLARVATDQLDRVERLDVRIGSADLRPNSHGFVPPYSIRTILDECTLEPMVFRNGRWSAVLPMSGQEPITFPAPVGPATAMYTLHSEVALFPVSFRERGLRHASFKIAFPPAFLAQIELLVELGLARTEPVDVRLARGEPAVGIPPRELLVSLLAERQSDVGTSSPDDCDVLRVVARGTKDGKPVELVEEMIVRPYEPWQVAAGDIDTGVPLAIAGTLLAGEGKFPTGAHGAERVFDAPLFLRELARYGMRARETTTRMLD